MKLRASLLFAGLWILLPIGAEAATPLTKEAMSISKKLPKQDRESSFQAAFEAFEADNDALAIASLAAALGVTVEDLSNHSRSVFDAPAPNDRLKNRNKKAAMRAASIANFGYDSSFDAPSTPRQSEAARAQKADDLYAYAITVRNLDQRRKLLTEAANLGHEKARIELRFY